ncbi:MAG TPA: DNA alkylation repair protein [Planctomycetota bacterium]|nr:DNA alkylation repair protein [Planctomycetota bacterium]
MGKLPDTRREVDEVRRRLKSMSNPAAAALARSALHSPLSFHGVIPPQVRALAREIARRHRRDRTLDGLLSTARALWKSRWHEERSTAIHMVAALVRRLDHDDWAEFKGWLKAVRSPDHCDGIAIDLLGSLVKRDRSWCRVLKHWTLSENIWERRASAMGVLLRTRQMGDVEAAFYICESLMRDKSPQVREAVVAVLTEAWGADARLTREFLERWRGKGAPALLKELVLPG